MAKYSQKKLLRLIASKNNKKTKVGLKMSNEQLKQDYGNKCAELGHAIVQSRLLGTKIETLFAELSKLQEQAAIPATPTAPAPAAEPVAPSEPSPVVEA
jgi:hypothetical protein